MIMPRGGKREGAGRPSGTTKDMSEIKSRRIVLLLTPAQEEKLKADVAAAGTTIPKYIKAKLGIEL